MSLTIIGTSHIAKQSIEEIKKHIEQQKPDIIAVELDKGRANSLLHGEKRKISISDIMQIGMKGYLFAKVGQIVQQKLGKIVGVVPGSEMKTALLLGMKNKIKVALIDQPIQITLKKLKFTWKERVRFIADFFKGIFFRKKQMEELGLEKFNLSGVPSDEVISKMMDNVAKRYPNVYKALVSDRNKYMVKKLVKLMRAHPGEKILCVVGAGHKKGMEELLLKVDVV
jgi:pheromone shutdown-related protein TraB